MITFTQGDDGIIISLNVVDSSGAPIDIAGATFQTQILGPTGALVTVPDDQHTIVDGPNGKFQFTMTAAQTGACSTGPNKDIITQIVNNGQTIYYRGTGILTVYAGAPTE